MGIWGQRPPQRSADPSKHLRGTEPFFQVLLNQVRSVVVRYTALQLGFFRVPLTRVP